MGFSYIVLILGDVMIDPTSTTSITSTTNIITTSATNSSTTTTTSTATNNDAAATTTTIVGPSDSPGVNDNNGSGVAMTSSQSFAFIIFVATLGIKITTSLY